ncbi:cingulin [Sitodiplosis mosellana]|uniref:cingulin n=1 Tax=Sitodiplosis mosellana TaxID=263140 RepID=UPI00244479B4|nr:cingulin [Sitodiplosis mosellana]
MDVPGLSLFQGTESIKLNNDQQRAEEEDAIEDRKRRNEELESELQNAFDDLDDFEDDDDVSVSYNASNSSANRRNAAALANPIFNGIETNRIAHLNSHDNERMTEILQLKNMLSSKNEELRIAASEIKNSQNKNDELVKRLAIAEAEKERAHMSRQQTHELFVESKQKLSERDEIISDLNGKIKSLNDKNLEVLAELEHTKSLLSDVQHKYHMVERNASYSSEKHADSMVKQINDRHAAQTDMMQQQINTMRTKLEDRDNELKRLMVQNNELQKSREAVLLDKADTINQLTHRLDDAQRQVQDLIRKNGTSGDLAQENVRLMRSVTALQQQTDEMQQTINELNLRLESTTTELEQLTETAINNIETISNSDHNLPTNGIGETPMIRKAVSHPRLAVSSTPFQVEDRITRLKQEFNRCVADQKAKRQEILALKEELAAKNKEIDRLKQDENLALIELNTSKENTERLAIRLKNMERELEDFKNKTESRHQEKTTRDENDRIQKLQQENENFRSNCNHLNETIRALEDERDRTEEKYREVCKEMAELQQKFSQLESNPCLECEKEKFLTKESREECTRLKELYIRITDEKEEALRKLRQTETVDLKKELLEQRNMVASLERSLQLAEMKYTEMSKILEREKTDHEIQIENLRAKYEAEITNIESKEQKDISNSCLKCVDLTAKLAKYEIEGLQLQTTVSGYLKDIHELKKSLKKAEQTITDLSGKLALKEEHEQLLDELKSKAKQFEEFMRNQSPTKSILVDAIVNSQTSRVRDQCVSTEDLIVIESPRPGSVTSIVGLDRSAEKRIREDMARAMALKVKAVENEFKGQILEFEQQVNELTTEVVTLQTQLKERETDVSNLKTCILKERFEVRNILEQKGAEHMEMMKQHQNDLSTTRNDLEVANKRVNSLLNELDQCKLQFQAERENMNKLMSEWKAQIAALAEREQNLTKQIHNMEHSYRTTVSSLNEKCMAAKKTAASYRKYSEDKEKHIEQESERIKLAYEETMAKIKDNMNKAIKDHEKRANRRISEMQAQLDVVMQKRK